MIRCVSNVGQVLCMHFSFVCAKTVALIEQLQLTATVFKDGPRTPSMCGITSLIDPGCLVDNERAYLVRSRRWLTMNLP